MTTCVINYNSNIISNNIQALNNFIGDGSQITNLTRNNISSNNPNYVLINDNDGLVSEQQYLDVSKGGTGFDSTGLNGYPKIINGIWSVNSDVLDNITNLDISNTAEINRNKIKLGNINEVIINNSTDGHLSSEAQLATSRGGTNLDTQLSSGIPRILNGQWSVDYDISNNDISSNANIQRNKIANGTSNYFVVNNENGTLSETSCLNISTGDLVINPTNNIVIQDKILYYDSDKLSSKNIIKITTLDNLSTNIYNLYTIPNTAYLIKFDAIAINITDNTSGSYSGIVKIHQLDIDTEPIISDIKIYTTIFDLGFTSSLITETIENNLFSFNVKGLLNKTLKWRMMIKIIANN